MYLPSPTLTPANTLMLPFPGVFLFLATIWLSIAEKRVSLMLNWILRLSVRSGGVPGKVLTAVTQPSLCHQAAAIINECIRRFTQGAKKVDDDLCLPRGKIIQLCKSFQNEEAQKYLDMAWYLSNPGEKLKEQASRSRNKGWGVGAHAKGDVLSPAVFPSMALIGNLLWFVYFQDRYCNGITCLPPPAQSWTLSKMITRWYFMQVSILTCGFPLVERGSQKLPLRAMARLVLQFTRDERVRLPLGQKGPVHLHEGLCPVAPSARTSASSGSFHEQKRCLLEPIIKSSLEAKSTYKASLQSEFCPQGKGSTSDRQVITWALHN